MLMHRAITHAIAAALVSLPVLGAGKALADDGDLAKAAQNPVADMISLPFQNNTSFGVGPSDGVVNVLNISR